MRILHLDSGREMRGGQWQVLRLHRGLVAAGHESLLLAREGAPLHRLCEQWGLPCRPLGVLRFRALAGGFDLVHAHDARTHTLAAIWSNRPFVVSRRVAFAVKSSLTSRWKYQRPRLFLAVSQFVAEKLREAGVPAERITVVYDGIPVPAKEASGDAILVPYSTDPGKGMALAQAAAARAGIHLEPSKDLEADLPRARAMVYLSQSEGLGSGILLAMAHGVSVIASNVGGIPELITDGVNGLLVPNDPVAIAESFGRLDRRFGLTARQTVLQRFTEQHMIESTLAAYQQVLR